MQGAQARHWQELNLPLVCKHPQELIKQPCQYPMWSTVHQSMHALIQQHRIKCEHANFQEILKELSAGTMCL